MTQKDAVEVGQAIKAARTSAGLSMRALANTSGVDVGYISNLENGRKTNPSMDVLKKLADALSVNIQEIVSEPSIKSESALPEPRVYFRRKFGVSEDEAEILAGLIEKYQQENK